jgi:hypothetical protein
MFEVGLMYINFCQHYQGDGSTQTNKYCRSCPESFIACDKLWQLVVDFSKSNDGKPVLLKGTNAVMLPNQNWDIVHLKVNAKWGLPKEDFLHFIATGHAKNGIKENRQDPAASPSLTRQEPYVQAIVNLIGGENIPEIVNVRNIQNKT